MTTSYTWTFGPLEAEDDAALEKVVKTIHWQVSGSDGTYEGQAIGTHNAGEPGEPYTAWADLTPEIIKGWLPANLVSQAEAAVQAQIDAKAADAAKNKIKGVPW